MANAMMERVFKTLTPFDIPYEASKTPTRPCLNRKLAQNSESRHLAGFFIEILESGLNISKQTIDNYKIKL